ncbi:MAG: sulfotransferase [Rhodobacteraceae bacterium]|nr:sulfotransferase [Paracoccaceae bacterium]
MTNSRYKSYMICTSPRSGSTLLCKLLEETGVAGNPGSYFHNPSLASWLQSNGLNADAFSTHEAALRAIYNAAIAEGRGDTAIFGLRMQRKSFDFFMQQTALLHGDMQTDVARIEAAFGPTLFIYLTRASKLDQAISLVKARQTGLWHMAADGTELERLSEPQQPYYDGAAIGHHLAELKQLDEAWKTWFRHENVQPLEVSYDRLSSDPRRILADILNALGLQKSLAANASPPTQKLADATSRQWAARYAAETTAG